MKSRIKFSRNQSRSRTPVGHTTGFFLRIEQTAAFHETGLPSSAIGDSPVSGVHKSGSPLNSRQATNARK